MTGRGLVKNLSLCLRSLCPVCGKGPLFLPKLQARSLESFFYPVAVCSACGFTFSREGGYYTAAFVPTLPVLSLLFGALVSGFVCLASGVEPLTALTWGGAGVLFGFFLFVRTSIAIYIAVNHTIEPPEKRDQDQETRG